MHDIEDDAFQILSRGRRKLRTHGGLGDPTVARIGADVLTVAHGVAVEIARRVVAHLELHHERPIHTIPLLAAHEEASRRIVGRQTTLGQVMAEIGRIRGCSERGAHG